MSGRYVSAVLESNLAPPVKFTAAAFASFADEHGGRIRPSMAHVAYLTGAAVRTVQYHATELRALGVLTLVRSPGHKRAAQYRMLLEKLPTRAPFRPPDRQAGLVLDEGESQAPAERVQPGAPIERVQPGAPFSGQRVQPGAPDPYVQEDPPDVHTQDTPAAGPPAKDGRGESAARLPLLEVPDPAHSAHAKCGRICVPKFLHEELKRAIGGRLATRPARLHAFYTATLEALADRPGPIDPRPAVFWRAAFAEAFTTRRAAPRRRAATYTGGASIDCPHAADGGARCATVSACTQRIIEDGRAERAAAARKAAG